MMMMRIAACLALALSLGGCVQQTAMRNDLVGYAPGQIKVAQQKAEAPAGISTVAFKELGDSKRYALVERLIRRTWDDSCQPASLQLDGYARNGASQWNVHCKDTVQARDYVVAIPEKADDMARVLKCHPAGPRMTSCSIIGPSETAPLRTTSTL